MRVLAIRGENLASLGQPFAIDFQVEPLAGTGLFAITGDTGSGKSTILDALCLALYGAYPRFAESQQDALPDPSGKKLSIPDGGTILRRGTGRGYAEVEFIGHDGLHYSARWEARRAHEKPDGNILGATRTLHQVDGANLTLLAQAKTTVQEAVDRLTGLKFEQFCRTVLLPQGEFDAFLLAAKTERADLLEKITGTQIYTRISKIVYSGTRALKEQAAALETRLTNLGLLSEEEREALEQAVTSLQAEVDSKSGEQQTLQAQITHLDSVAQARRRIAEAEQSVHDSRGSAEAARPDRDRWAALESVEPLRPFHDKLKAAVSQQPASESKVTDAHTAHQSLTQQAETAQAELDSSRVAHAATEQTFTDYGPVWDEAQRLDTALSNAHSEVSTAEGNAETARAALDNVNQELDSLQKQMNGTQADLDSASASLQKQSKLAAVADNFNQIEELFVRFENQTADVTKFSGQKATAEEAISTLSSSMEGLNAQIIVEAELQQQSATAAESLDEQLKSSEEKKWLTQQNRVSALQLTIPGLQNLIVEYQTSAETLETAAIEHERASADRNEAEARKHGANWSLPELTSQRAEIQRNTELAEQSIDQRNAHLRSLLNDGESCPICGATEHPYTAPGTQDSLTELANSLRQNRSDLDGRIATTQNELLSATRDFTTATGKLENAARNRINTTRQMENFTAEFSEQRSEIEAVCARFALTLFLPETVTGGDDALSLMQQLKAKTATLSSTATNRLSAITELRRQLDSENTSAREAQQRLNSAREAHQREQPSLNEAKLAAANATGAITQAGKRVAEIEDELSLFLAMADITLETLREDPTTVLVTLRSHTKEITTFRGNQQSLETKLRQLTEQHGRLSVSKDAAAQRYADADSTLAQRNEVFEKITGERALILDGDDTHSHRTRINSIRLQAQREFETAQIKERGMAQSLATAAQQKRSASDALANLLQEIQQGRNSYQNECALLGVEVAVANDLLTFPAGEAKTLKARLDTLDQAVRDAETTLEDRKDVLDGLSKEVAEVTDRATLAVTLAQINSVITQANQDIGNKQGRLKTDDQLRLNAADIRRAADEKAVELATWQQVEDAIGSANGDRFRTFAQSVTLDQLVRLANEHLDNFSKRYQLARSHDADLSLHIIDNDMGEEHRAIRSLSGGERFLVSLSLALSLAGLEGNEFTVDTLFIDEGFGALDEDTLDVAITALEMLHSQGRKVGVITHVAAMIESIPVQVKVEKLGGGSSIVRIDSLVGFA